jgi:PAS domain S-box-containing protein
LKISEYLRRTPWTIIGIFAILAAGILATGYSYFDTQKNHLKREQYEDLSAIADLKSYQIIQWRNERLNDAEVIRVNPLIADEIATFQKNPANPRTRHNIVTWMKLMQTNYGYGSIFLCDGKGKIGLSNIIDGDTLGSKSRNTIAEVLRDKHVILSDLYRENSSSPIHMNLVVPIMSGERNAGVITGVCLFRIDPQKLLFPLILVWPTPSRSSETLLICREGDYVLFLNELRHQKNTALTLQLPVAREKLIAGMALRGVEGTVEGIDYRGVPVLAAIRKIQNSAWFMIAKVDQEEVYGSLRAEAWRVVIITFILIFATAASLGFLWRHQRAIFYRDKYNAEIERKALITHFDYLTKYANDIIFMTDEHMMIVEINDRCLEVYGYTRDEIHRLGVRDLRALETLPDLSAHKRLIDEHHGATYETIHRKKDGTTFPIELSVRSFEIEGIRYYQAIGRDITERKQVESELKASEQRYRFIADNINDVLWIFNLNTNRWIYISPSIERLRGYSVEEVMHQTLDQLMTPESYARVESVLQNRIGGMTADSPGTTFYTDELEQTCKDGSTVWTDVTTQYLKNELGEITILGISRNITERRKSEEALRQSEEFYRAIIEHSHDAVTLIAADGTILYDSPSIVTILGYSPTERVGRKVFEFSSPSERETMEMGFSRFVQKVGTVMQYEGQFLHKDGSVRWIEGVRTNLLHMPAVNAVVVNYRDITERKFSAEALQSSESFLNSIIDQSPIPMWISDAMGTLIRINTACLDLLNITAAEVVGKYNILEDSIVEEEGFLPLVKKVFDEGTTARFELQYESERLKHLQLKNFAKVILDVTIFPIRNNSGKITNTVIQHVDISARKRAEQIIHESEQRLSSIYETVGDILFLVEVSKNSEYRFSSVNPAFFSVTGLTPETILGKRVNEIIPEPSLTLVLSNYGRAISEKRIVRWEETTTYPTGTLTGEVSIAPIFDKEGTCTHLVGAVHDITERKKNELKILKLNRTYAVLSNVNQLIVRERDREKMLDGVCRIAITDGGFSMAWVGLLREESNIITPIASAGNIDSYLDHLNLTPSETPEGRGRIGEDLRNGHSVIINDIEHNKRSTPWRERALERGYRSSAVFPLRKGNTTIGTFSFYSNESQFFTIDEVRLLEELAMDVSYALDSLELEAQRKRAEKALQVSEKNFRTFIESAPDAVFVQTQLRFAYLNPAALKLFGAGSAEQMLGQPVMERMYPETRDRVRERIQKLNNNEETVPKLEQKYLQLDGTTVDVEVSAVPIFYEGYHGALVFVSDITQRKRIGFYTEKLIELKQQLLGTKGFNQKLEIITKGLVNTFGADFARVWIIKEADLCEKGCIHAKVNTGPDVCRNRTSCLHLISSSGRYTGINGSHRRVPFGAYKIGRVASGEDNKFITNDAVNDSRVHNHEWAASLGLVAFAGFRLISTEGKPIGVLALFRNRAFEYYEEQFLEDVASTASQIIHARTAEEALEESETRAHFLADVIQNASQPFVSSFADGRLDQFNAAFLKLTGYTEEEIVSINWTSDLTPPEWRDFEASKLDELHRTDRPVRYEKEYIRKDGSRVPIELLVHLHKNEQGQPEYYYAFVTDITEQQRLQSQLLQSQKIQSIGTLAGGIAHDFNNILGIIMGYAALLERGGVTSVKFFSHINAIKLSVERGASLVRQILTFARKTDVAFEPVHLPDLVNDIVSMLKETFPKMITLQSVIEEDIPSINADRTQLHQALLNLCVNARDAMPNGGELMITVEKVKRHTLTKRFPSADQDYYVSIRVSDTGIGMSEEIKTRIFDPFFTTKEKGKGTGLGLSVVLGIVQSHRGFADVESAPGMGTTFTLFIPLPSYQKKEPGKQISEDRTVGGGSETILIVEDEILLLEITQSILESNGYKILTAGDGEQAIEVYTRHQEEIALVITDMGMPKLSGVEEIKILRQINPNVKVILATGFLEPGAKDALLAAGAKAIMQKPYVARELLGMIREILETPDE